MQNNYSLHPLTLYGLLCAYLCKYKFLGVEIPDKEEETIKKIQEEAKGNGNEVGEESGDVEKVKEKENSVENENNEDKEKTSGMLAFDQTNDKYILSFA